MWKQKEWMVIFLLFGGWITIVSCSCTSNNNHKNVIFHPPSSLMVVVSLRNGGGTSDDDNDGGSLKQKRKRRKRTTAANNKDVWEESLKKKDSSLGDAIRQRADILQKDTFQPQQQSQLQQVDASLYSLRWGLGCSSPSLHYHSSGGVEVSFSAVVAQYFLSSHGGTHGIQCILSFFAVLFSLTSTMTWNITLLKRTFMCGMMKHASSLLASAILSAQRIPIHGFRNTRTLLHHHPLSQYLFYNSLWILYLTITTTTTTKLPKYIHIAIVGPVLIRELISTLLVLTDIWVLYQGTQKSTTTTSTSSLTLLSSMKYQTKLAKFVNQISTILEYITAMYMSKQTLTSLQHLLLATSNHPKQPSSTTTTSSSIKDVVLQLICTKLYLAYIYTKQKHNKQQPPPTTTTTDNPTHDKKKKKKMK